MVVAVSESTVKRSDHTRAAAPRRSGYTTLDISFMSTLIVIGVIGIFANGFILFAVLRKRESRRKATNVFVCNQNILDLITSFSLILMFGRKMVGINITAAPGSSGPPSPLSWFSCLLVDSGVILGFTANPSIASLVVINLERYAKIYYLFN
jgi:heme O synthase-like polyprenyltransferase